MSASFWPNWVSHKNSWEQERIYTSAVLRLLILLHWCKLGLKLITEIRFKYIVTRSGLSNLQRRFLFFSWSRLRKSLKFNVNFSNFLWPVGMKLIYRQASLASFWKVVPIKFLIVSNFIKSICWEEGICLNYFQNKMLVVRQNHIDPTILNGSQLQARRVGPRRE